jgi:hypothetical protein
MIPSENGAAWNPNNALRQFKTLCKRSTIRVIRIHDMRHTAALQGLARGVRLEAVSQAALGHSRPETTITIYAPNIQQLSDEFTTTNDAGFTGTLLVQNDLEMTEWGNENGTACIWPSFCDQDDRLQCPMGVSRDCVRSNRPERRNRMARGTPLPF